ncbi:MAG: hemerythrin domain-containing protein [Chloroflexi bacterium]|nr:hemerythrin domain-containing protein [Chloroflexota bacterium]
MPQVERTLVLFTAGIQGKGGSSAGLPLKVLFPEFDNFMPRGGRPLAVMLDEHETLRNTNEVMQEAIAKYLKGDDSIEVKKAITQNGMHLIKFLRSHSFKEDNIPFRMAEMRLKPEQNERVVKLFYEMEKGNRCSWELRRKANPHHV